MCFDLIDMRWKVLSLGDETRRMHAQHSYRQYTYEKSEENYSTLFHCSVVKRIVLRGRKDVYLSLIRSWKGFKVTTYIHGDKDEGSEKNEACNISQKETSLLFSPNPGAGALLGWQTENVSTEHLQTDAIPLKGSVIYRQKRAAYAYILIEECVSKTIAIAGLKREY